MGRKPSPPNETVAKMRKMITGGMSRRGVARALGLSVSCVHDHTYDLPKIAMKRLTPEQRNEIKVKRMSMSAREIAGEYGISPITVWAICRNTAGGFIDNRLYMGGKTLEILKELASKGYFISRGEHSNNFITMRKHLPIKRVHIKNRAVYFLEGRELDAFRGLVASLHRKTISQNRLSMTADLFGIKINSREEKMLL